MSAPAGLATVWDLKVEGSEGCAAAAAAYANATMPSAAVMRSCLIMVSPDIIRERPSGRGLRVDDFCRAHSVSAG